MSVSDPAPGTSSVSAEPVRAVVAVGANLGDRDATLRAAVTELAATPGVTVLAASVPVESIALTLDGLDESKPSYLNGAVLVSTTLSALDLLDALNRIEDDHGRVRVERWGDRTLDLDLIVHGDTIVDTPRLTLPHPRAAERSFVLEPWLQVDPGAVLPGHGPVAVLLQGLQDPIAPVAGAPRLDQPALTPESAE
ncbi:2-amino-4-hydroxy-6-hydroxymethyldihydropteridine diphosphokinase [Frondihabitans australicus]|uniref:2-amino-4-hydroxy-6-hydroxymethyldihydropteridine diphosphokinase n=1 Tax=Frondihabitans australicus TaxID=386892 RepID=A0A495II86_9MICO|nr:2-amino-4-hydroxy-6-hydroxymethyldihydropteridine diphosphokinase [Frondihabitans australicus]RKR75703.1 2-amino-4-hydroxy-6-hydroxymethyldihydropteridine diphosphokinase [Frondihabitans australicus]